MMDLDKSDTICQPCANFRSPDWEQYPPQPHECPRCGGTRYFCMNCSTDHHKGGWNTCAVDRDCAHPACKERKPVAGEDSRHSTPQEAAQ